MKYYFLENHEWYYRNKDGKYILMPIAPQKAIESYEQYLKDRELDNLVSNINSDLSDIRNKFKPRNK